MECRGRGVGVMSAVEQPESQGRLDLPGEPAIESTFSILDDLEKMTERQREDMHVHTPRFVAAPPEGVRPLFVVKESKKPVCRDVVARRVKARPDAELTAQVRALWDEGVDESYELSRRFVALAPFWAGREDMDADPYEVEQQDLMVAVAMRCTRGQAAKAITDAHRAVDLLPRCTQALEAGEFPAEWFRTLLRRTADFTPAEMVLVDVTVASWCLAIMPRVFTKCLDLLVTKIQQRHPKEPEEVSATRRRMVLDPGTLDGVASLRIIGPAPEIKALGGKFDQAARAIQNAQRHALMEGTEIPLDPDRRVENEGMPLSLNLIRYHLAHAAQIDTGGITVPEARFRLNVLVPFLTLVGGDDAPGVLEDGTPIPAQMAREIAGKSEEWFRVLTDPSSGEFLPRPADKYRPTGAMLEHLRLRGQSCGVPGCERTASVASEADHIVEYNHADPVCGGRTAVENLHFLCWFHHAMKTAGRLDPVRVEADESPGGTAGTVWEMQERFRVFREDDTDLLTPQAVAQLDAVWDSMQRRQDDYEQRRDAEDGTSAESPSPDPARLDSPWPIRAGVPDPWPRVDMDHAGAPDLEEVPVEKPVRRRYQPLPTFHYDGDIPISATTRRPRKRQDPPPKFDPGPPPF
ncbi:HNH endonuclease signature motif containing protein [Brachybacterium kimchii]|uniref:HNH endonuclease n=1 Tax=Brachybacterium kimchii TaxID=2942909 RepID=A0ABY4N4L2_9MICO|nr:HNH endonuclease signature motif containing protein [Brachybacterium kimchii]UQN28388.1 HNH endonuclease [Brachybacterium kimchii]